jgi:hypothetical protein
VRLVRYNLKTEKPVLARLGAILEGEIVVDLKAAYGRCLMERGEHYWKELSALVMPGSAIAFLTGGSASIDHLKTTCRWSETLLGKDSRAQGFYGEPLFTPYSDCRLHAPVRPTKLAVVRFPSDSAGGLSISSKPVGTIVGPTRNIIPPAADLPLKFAPGVAIVIGRACRSIGEEEAEKAIAGYMLMTDVMLADSSGHYGDFTRSMYETFAPSGPWLQLGETCTGIAAQTVSGFLNRKMIEQFELHSLAWSVRRTVSYLSKMGLEPGDAIWLGKAAGDNVARLGDQIATKVDLLGQLQNAVDTKQPPN